ncbi:MULTISPECIES: gluconate 2-dehydrogenase subunit 3 family protein [unclassified Variovorax]|uniref:gluconate 2-dehydrogenase subunit 3 family protein n=1 Tax=unclassified Variovorax TaxID=663243 RepID=UPI001317C31E|nr:MULTISPECIES: gluconate 2-dehydrogenase subunit 3 family protein [unclassified Variovorax]VTU15817.1 Gluconate 2-dehydrogenase subunit 3 precursor [Variovorax sp. SRS16]VTU23939.1 Gluconate 2-dehydrogenase subunit 3 precursor [Variovorax sp. PBL-E5]
MHPHAYLFLTQPEVRFLEAAAERLIPADELGPGACDAGVASFIDGQLASPWGMHGRQYRTGPWHEGTPQQGFQSRLVPQEIYRLGIREIDQHCVAAHGKRFDLLPVAVQDELLRAMERDALPLPSLSSGLFFTLLFRNTMEGFFADPMYGGNRDKVGWRLIGFPGVAASNYVEHLAQHNVRYEVEPVSILDIEAQRAKVDSQGYARHVLRRVDPAQ